MNKRRSIIVAGRFNFLSSKIALTLCAVLLLVAIASPLRGEIRSETIKLWATAVSESQVALTWTIPAGAVRYRIYRDGSLLTTTVRISEYDAGLRAEIRYCYHVSAIDDKNIEFSRSNEVCTTTLMAEATERQEPIKATPPKQ